MSSWARRPQLLRLGSIHLHLRKREGVGHSSRQPILRADRGNQGLWNMVRLLAALRLTVPGAVDKPTRRPGPAPSGAGFVLDGSASSPLEFPQESVPRDQKQIKEADDSRIKDRRPEA